MTSRDNECSGDFGCPHCEAFADSKLPSAPSTAYAAGPRSGSESPASEEEFIVTNIPSEMSAAALEAGATSERVRRRKPSAPSPAGEDWFPYPVAAPVSTKGVRSRPYRESLLRDLRDPKEAIAYLSASIEDSPEMYAKALSNIFAAQVAAPDPASLVLVPRNPTPEMFAAAGGKSIANYVWRKMIAAWEDRIE